MPSPDQLHHFADWNHHLCLAVMVGNDGLHGLQDIDEATLSKIPRHTRNPCPRTLCSNLDGGGLEEDIQAGKSSTVWETSSTIPMIGEWSQRTISDHINYQQMGSPIHMVSWDHPLRWRSSSTSGRASTACYSRWTSTTDLPSGHLDTMSTREFPSTTSDLTQ